ncbi:MAG: hypothetical protein WED81_01800 [Rhodothermales bacterium]
MEEFLDEWNGYAFTGQFLGRKGEIEFEYVAYVFNAERYLFTQRLHATDEFLTAQGLDLKAGPYRISGLLQGYAMDLAKQRLRKRDFGPSEEYVHQLVLESQV